MNALKTESVSPLVATKLRIHFRVLERITLPPYKGSSLRGALGAALRQIMCATRRPDCADCLLVGSCIYQTVFETTEDGRSVARPYVLEPPLEQKQLYQPGEDFTFSLLLIGRAIRYLPYILVALQAMGQTGLGKGRGRMELIRLEQINPFGTASVMLFSSISNAIYQLDDNLMAPTIFGALQRPDARCVLEFVTPTRLTSEGHLQDQLSFSLLLRVIMRRLHDLANSFGDGPTTLDYPRLLEMAQDISLETADIQWVDWERFSSRQQTRMKLGGIVGRACFTGDLTPFSTLLRWGELIHIGKGTVFGLGQYRLLR